MHVMPPDLALTLYEMRAQEAHRDARRLRLVRALRSKRRAEAAAMRARRTIATVVLRMQ